MRGSSDRNRKQSKPDTTTHAGNSRRCFRREFVGTVGAAGTVGGLSGLSPVAVASDGRASGASTAPLSQRWSAQLSGTVQDYLVATDALYVATEAGRIRAFDPTTGRETNSLDLGAPVRPYGLARAGQYLAAGLADGRLAVVRADTFSEELRVPLSGEIRAVTATDGAVFLATGSTVQRIALPDGAVQWRFERRNVSPLWVTSEGIGVSARPTRPGAGSNFYVLSEADGEVVWEGGVAAGGLETDTGNWLQRDRFWALTELDSQLVATGVGFSDSYVCFEKFTGEKLWTATGSDTANRVVGTPQGVVHQDGSSLVSRDRTSGESQWRTDVVTPHAKGMCTYDDSLVVFGNRPSDGADVVTALDPTSRAVEWEQRVDDRVGLVSVAGNVLFGVALGTDEIRAYLPENAQVDLPDRGTPTADRSPDTPAASPTSTRVDTSGPRPPSGSGTAGRPDAEQGRPERGFFTNGERSALAGLSSGNTLSLASVVVTVVSILLSLVQMLRGK